MKKWFAILIFCAGCFVSEEIPPDQDTWDYGLPKDNQFDQDSLLILNQRITNNEFAVIDGLSIVKNSELVFENYYTENASRQSARFIGKAGLLVTLAAVGIAVDERLFSVEDSIYQYLPEFRAFFDDEPSKKNIRIRDLLTHRSGLSWNEIVPLWVVENGEIVPNQRNTLVQMRASDDWVSFTLERRLTNIGRYQFCTANGVLLAKILENASGVTFEKYIQERLFAPLEIIHPPIGQDQAGNSNGGDGYILSLLDLTKIGFLFLKRGVWKGRTLVNNNFAKDAMSRDFQFSQSATENSIGYFFTFFGSGIQPLLNIPYSEIVFFVSEDGSALFIAPEEDMVASIFSENPFGFNFPAGYSLFAEITRTIR